MISEKQKQLLDDLSRNNFVSNSDIGSLLFVHEGVKRGTIVNPFFDPRSPEVQEEYYSQGDADYLHAKGGVELQQLLSKTLQNWNGIEYTISHNSSYNISYYLSKSKNDLYKFQYANTSDSISEAQKHRLIGQLLGYPQPAIEHWVDEEQDRSAYKQYIEQKTDISAEKYGLASYYVSYLPRPTSESIRRIIRVNENAHRKLENIYETTEPNQYPAFSASLRVLLENFQPLSEQEKQSL